MKSQTTAVLAGFTALLALASPVAQAQYVYKTLSAPLPSSGSAFAGIDGTNIVGSYNDTGGTEHGFIYSGSNYTTLDDPLAGSKYGYGEGTWATGISGTNIVGYYYNDAGGTSHGFLYDGATWATLDDPLAGSGKGTFPSGIAGTNIVGYYLDTNSAQAAHGFFYNGSDWITLDYPGSADTYAQAISGAAIVGSFTDTNGVGHGFLFNGGTWTALDAPGSTGTFAEGISGVHIVGYYTDTNGVWHGFIYDGSDWTTLDDPLGGDGTDARGISGSNIVGNYYIIETSGVEPYTLGYGFLYSAGIYQTLDDPLNSLPTDTVPSGIDGTNIVGCFMYTGGGGDFNFSPEPWQGFVWSNNTWSSFVNPLAVQFANIDLGLTTPVGTVASGISGTNIVGYYFDSDLTAHGFVYSGGIWTILDDPMAGVSTPYYAFRGTFPKGISGSNIVGYYLDTNSIARGFIYNGGAWTTLDDPLADSGTFAYGISGSNIVGYYADAGVSHGFLWDGSAYQTLDAPEASESGPFAGTYAAGISGANIVGYYYDTKGIAHGFLYDGNNWTILDVQSAGSIEGTGTFAQGISGGNIVGFFGNASADASIPGANGFLATPLPKLAVASSGSGVKLSWPSNPLASWLLEQTASLGTTHWTPTPGVSNDGTNNFITVTPSSQTQFFRLTLQ